MLESLLIVVLVVLLMMIALIIITIAVEKFIGSDAQEYKRRVKFARSFKTVNSKSPFVDFK